MNDSNMYEAMADYEKMLIDEAEKQVKQSEEVLLKVKSLVSEEYFEAVKSFVKDEEIGIWGDLKIVDEPIGEWQNEYYEEADYEYDEDDYWVILKGMFVNQSCGYSGDDYNGTVEIKIKDKYLRCSYSL